MFGKSSSARGFVVYCSVILVIAVSIPSIFANDEYEDVKVKRGGNVGLFPFPRVGRSDPELSNWDPALLNSLDDYNEMYHAEAKRQGLIPFPRVGRSGYKPTGGVWVPNHLINRIQKRSSGLN